LRDSFKNAVSNVYRGCKTVSKVSVKRKGLATRTDSKKGEKGEKRKDRQKG